VCANGRAISSRSGAWQAALDRANLCIGYVATMFLRCHKAVWASCMSWGAAREGAPNDEHLSEAPFRWLREPRSWDAGLLVARCPMDRMLTLYWFI